MSSDPRAQAALALHRFGLGPRPGSIAQIAADPRGALLAELDKPNARRIDQSELMTSAQAARAAFEARAERRAKQIVEQRAQKAAEAKKGPDAKGEGMSQDIAQAEKSADPAKEAKPGQPKQPPPLERQIFLAEVKARLDAALDADIGFAERLVRFWSNHFCVSAAKGPLAGHGRRLRARGHPPARPRPLRAPCCRPSRAIRPC